MLCYRGEGVRVWKVAVLSVCGYDFVTLRVLNFTLRLVSLQIAYHILHCEPVHLC